MLEALAVFCLLHVPSFHDHLCVFHFASRWLLLAYANVCHRHNLVKIRDWIVRQHGCDSIDSRTRRRMSGYRKLQSGS